MKLRQQSAPGPTVGRQGRRERGRRSPGSCCFAASCFRRWRRPASATPGAALVATAGWTALHCRYSALDLAAVFGVGLHLSLVPWRTGSLWIVIACPGLYNLAPPVAIRLVDLPA